MTDPTPAYSARRYLAGLASAFYEGTSPNLDPAMCGGIEFPQDFERLTGQWANCLSAATVINQRYYEDWNRASGALTVIAPRTREAALSELRIVWNMLCRNYIAMTLDRDRIAWDCPRCGEHVGLSECLDYDRCPYCSVLLTTNDSRTDWV